ncbi:WD repeat-containing protein 75 [Manduca sexta]|uniref:WD repeat-containing protein 75 second beta-propeller domain-containing protein n=1 Tax=Manduca sexta TaxID=7130 RepID=A0A921YQI8_MANSE|nr:WD repeat-containing protein 75 [Manduca sexta]KAG6443741.1 hypothetical protein O3G_MSEX002989 [Manduca sexta]
MVVKVDNTIKTPKYSLHRKAGRNIIERRPIFSPDGESLAVIAENVVRVYNVRTGDLVRTLETQSNVEELVAIEFPENENYDLYGCSSHGCVTIWTWETGAVIREVNLRIPSKTKILTYNLINNNECFITAAGGPTFTKTLHVAAYSVKTGDLLHVYENFALWNTNSLVKVSLGWCNGDRYAAIINGTKFLYIQSIHQPHLMSIIHNQNDLRIIAVAAHHSESSVAITDTLGRVTIIRGNLYDRRTLAREVMHWHSLPPLAVCFSVQGSYLYSGGMETVLVKWTVGSLAFKANEKAFIPRLPGHIRYITANNIHVAITLSNNSVVLANAQMRVTCTILESGGMSPMARAVGSSLLYHNQFEALLMNGRTGHLQLYSTNTNKVLYNIDITGINPMQGERWNLLPLDMEVTCATISLNGYWLVTSEYRNDGVMYPEEKLKFWLTQSGSKDMPFKLNTCVNLSHGGCRVVSLALNSKGDFCVSAGTDQKFRIWKREQAGRKSSWSCHTACYYSSGITQSLSHGVLNNYKMGELYKAEDFQKSPHLRELKRNDIIKKILNVHKEHSLIDGDMIWSGMTRDKENDMGGVAISKDGSLIAAWFGCKLTLWDTHLCNLRTALSHPALRPKGVHVKFGNQDAAHYLVCTTETCLAVWSLLSLTVKWLVQINPTCLTSDWLTNKMAVVTSNNDVYVFSPQSSKPSLVEKQVLSPKTGVFKQITFGAPSGNDVRLYLLRNDAEIYCIEPEQTEEGKLEVISERKSVSSKFSALVAEQHASAVRAAAPGHTDTPDLHALTNAAKAQISQAAPHMVPSVSLLCTSFLQELSGHQQTAEDNESETDDKMEVDSSDDEDADIEKLNGPYPPKATDLWTPNYEAVKEKKLNKIMHEPFLDLHSTSSLFGV